MSEFYANIVLSRDGAAMERDAVALFLKRRPSAAYLARGVRGEIVVFHQDFAAQEALAAALSAQFSCAALLAMVFGRSVLLYQLYQQGRQVDSYVSSPADGLELDGPPPPGAAAILCAAFSAERFERRVQSILDRVATPDSPYEYAVNRHGDLLGALRLPAIAAGTGFAQIELGDLPAAPDFDPLDLVRVG